jgi:O-antigen/teichoic acid export membrane protein
LAVSRLVDQGVVGLTSLLLAARLGVEAFVPVSALLVVNSFSVAASDFGLGTELLRAKSGTLSRQAVHGMRRTNLFLLVVAALVGLLFEAPARDVVIGGGLVWACSAEAFVRKSALIRLGHARRAAIGELAGSAVFAVAVLAVLVDPLAPVPTLVAGLVGKHLLEACVNRGWDDVYSGDGASRWDLWLWSNSILNFAVSNVDFVLIAWFVSAEAFAVYSVGFRVAAALVAQLSYVVNRSSLVDFGEAHRERSLSSSYQRRRGQMLRVGILAGAATALCSPALLLLGGQWRDSVGVVLVLACVVPWRMCGGLGLNVVVAANGARRVAVCEAWRLAGATVVLAFGAQSGLGSFTFVAACVAIATAVAYDRLALRMAGGPARSALQVTAPVGVVAAALATWAFL